MSGGISVSEQYWASSVCSSQVESLQLRLPQHQLYLGHRFQDAHDQRALRQEKSFTQVLNEHIAAIKSWTQSLNQDFLLQKKNSVHLTKFGIKSNDADVKHKFLKPRENTKLLKNYCNFKQVSIILQCKAKLKMSLSTKFIKKIPFFSCTHGKCHALFFSQVFYYFSNSLIQDFLLFGETAFRTKVIFTEQMKYSRSDTGKNIFMSF